MAVIILVNDNLLIQGTLISPCSKEFKEEMMDLAEKFRTAPQYYVRIIKWKITCSMIMCMLIGIHLKYASFIVWHCV